MIANKLLSACGGEKLYSDDVASFYTYTGTGSTLTITDGIDRTKGALDIFKGRSGATDWAWYDTVRGVQQDLVSNSTAGQTTQSQGVTATSSTGITIGTLAKLNTSSATYEKITFREAEKFFDILTWTGNNVSTGTVKAHTLNSSVGMVIVKATSTTSDWYVWHRGCTSGNFLKINTTDAQSTLLASTYFGNGTTTVDPTSTGITVGLGLNTTGVSYVAYVFAHDDVGADGIIQCGSFTTDGSGNATVSLGWEPQYLMVKRTDSSASGDWFVNDSMRGFTTSASSTEYLRANTSNAAVLNGPNTVTATGFSHGGLAGFATFVYLAIRRPNKPPTSGTQVYNAAVSQVGKVPAYDAGWPIDLAWRKNKTGSNSYAWSRLTGGTNYLNQNMTSAETSWGSDVGKFDSMTSWFNQNENNTNFVSHMFRRAPGFMDEVCYTGTGAARTVAHNLGAVPELVIIKARTDDGVNQQEWVVGTVLSPFIDDSLVLNSTAPYPTSGKPDYFNATRPSSTVFSLGEDSATNNPNWKYVAYLWASLPGISKCFSYTGNGGAADSAGTSQTIDCGFTTGARFVMLKCSSHASDWIIIDTVRGLISGNDPALSLNTTAAEVTTTDILDPTGVGFVVNQLATGTTSANFNVTGRTYIGLAIA